MRDGEGEDEACSPHLFLFRSRRRPGANFSSRPFTFDMHASAETLPASNLPIQVWVCFAYLSFGMPLGAVRACFTEPPASDKLDAPCAMAREDRCRLRPPPPADASSSSLSPSSSLSLLLGTYGSGSAAEVRPLCSTICLLGLFLSARSSSSLQLKVCCTIVRYIAPSSWYGVILISLPRSCTDAQRWTSNRVLEGSVTTLTWS
mmetsp:Transcript_15481/g.34656  ORF Transcript_15481/g.34656 Transcript_15481/m.34656 type:complete len:204 (-) Transcript_15481:1219-1830(-)